MFVYFLIIVLSLIYYLLSGHWRGNKKIGMYILFSFLILISALRNETIGDDYSRYVDYYDLIARTGDAYFKEKGYVYFNYLLSKVSTNYICLAFGVTLSLFIPLAIHIKKNVRPDQWAFCVLVFALNPYMYVQTSFNLLRQCCATGIVLLAVQLFSNRNLTKWFIGLILIFCAAQFHRSAVLLIMFIIPCVITIKWSSQLWRLIFLVCIGMNLIGGGSLINGLLSAISYEGYSSYEASLLNNPFYLILCLAFVWWLTSIYDNLDESYKTDFYVKLYMICMCILPLAVSNDMIYRLRIYLLFISLPGLVKIMYSYENCALVNDYKLLGIRIGTQRISSSKSIRTIYILYHVFFFIAYFLYLYIKKDTSYVPFVFVH